MNFKIKPKMNIKANIDIPGDKSISHRALIIGSLTNGKTKVKGLLEAEDCLNTLEIMRSLGVNIEKKKNDEYHINGVGLKGLSEPNQILDCGNSGTAMRLLTGLLAAQSFYSVLSGDSSLSKRPMNRIINPLTKMGAEIISRKRGKAPLSIKGKGKTNAINYKLPVASAQVKSSLLLAALYSNNKTTIEEPAISRDHTERMLKAAGIKIEKKEKIITLKENNKRELQALSIEIPGDISSAAFFIAAALIIPGSKITLNNIGLNPTRSGFLEIIEKMGANIEYKNKREVSGEIVADLIIKYSKLHGIVIKGDIIPRLIDEIPILSVLATQAEGNTIIKDAEELRIKETDRIKAMTTELKKLEANIEELTDGMIIRGKNNLKGNIKVKSYFDHRIAMSLAILGLKTKKGIIIENSEVINTSFPEFQGLIKKI